MPVAVAQRIRLRWHERCLDRTFVRFHEQFDSAVDHLQDDKVSLAVHRQQMPGRRAWLYIQLNIEPAIRVESVSWKKCKRLNSPISLYRNLNCRVYN